jgi:SAM-dependent methyltransferase
VTARDDYERYLTGRHRPAHGRRTADRWAAFIAPHLRPGMRLLDIGCGPGSITAGLHGLTGAAVGVDADPVPGAGVPVAAADAVRLPFPDAAFDALYANAVLQHVPDPLALLREARRVARPGAVIGVGDADWDGVLTHPHDPLIERGDAIREALRPAGDVRVGRRLRALLAEAGFERAEASASASAEGTGEAARRLAAFEGAWFASPEVVAYVDELGVAAPGEMAAVAAAWSRWAEDPGAFVARFWITAVAWAPKAAG